MQKLLREYLEERSKRRRKNRRAGIAMLLLAALVVGCVSGALSRYGVAMTGNVKCGIEEHQHGAECYKSILICGREEDPGHIHSDECLYQEELVCGLEEDGEHVHTEECRMIREGYACGEEEREAHFHNEACYMAELACEKEEHIHTDICYNDANADVETEEIWVGQYAGVSWTGAWGADLVSAARVQLGYQESAENFNISEDGSHKGYTRYGAFVGEPYGNWDAAFVSFCLHYAGIRDRNAEAPVLPGVTDSAKWCEEFEKMKEGNHEFLAGPEGYAPVAGDLVFFQRENEETAVQMGIVASVNQEANEIHVIEGNSQNEVKENVYPLNGGSIVRYLKLTELEASCKGGEEVPVEETSEGSEESSEEGLGGHGQIFTTEEPEGQEVSEGSESQEAFEVSSGEEEPTVDLSAEVDGTRITLSGPQSSFEEGKEYSIQAEKIEDKEMIAAIEEAIAPLEAPDETPEEWVAPDETREEEPEKASEEPEPAAEEDPEEAVPLAGEIPETAVVPDALAGEVPREQKAAVENGQSKQIKSYQAFDIKLMADGEEAQPLGPVSVKFSSKEVVDSVEDEGTEVKVVHVDEITGEATDMEAVATEEKDVVIETDHFSVYVYVEVGEAAIEGVTIDIQHWGENIETIDKEESGDNGGFLEEAFDTANPQEQDLERVVTKQEKCKLYTTDLDFSLPSETYMDVQKLSKVYNADQGVRYEITKVWVSRPGRAGNCAEDAETWGEDDYTEYTKEQLADEAVIEEINNLENGSVIRFWYAPSEEERNVREAVTFFDYDFSTGVQNGGLKTKEQGINARENFKNDGTPKMGVGQVSSGNVSPWAIAGASYGNMLLNAGNGNAALEGLVEANLDGQGNLVFNPAVDVPKNLFNAAEGIGSTQYNDYQLEFSQNGDTYTLINVYKGNDLTFARNLTQFKTMPNWNKTKYVYSNDFWPLDDLNATDPLLGEKEYALSESPGGQVGYGKDPKANVPMKIGRDTGYGQNDFKTEAGHNWYFGMTYTVNFEVGDYTGPLEYYFRGDDDFWLFCDGERIVDLGGIHTALGKTFNLREYMEGKVAGGEKDEAWLKGNHVLKVYYMERGATGSTCYMQFTLPKAKIEPVPEPETTSYTVEKRWEDNQNGFRPQDIAISLYKIKGTEKVKARTIRLPLRDEEGRYIDQDGNLVDQPVWTYTWEGLPVKDGKFGTPITYDAEEEYIAPENKTNPMLGYTYKKETRPDNSTWITFTNTIEDKKVKVKKTWEGDEKELENRPDKVVFVLYANGAEYRDYLGNRRTVVLTADNGWEGEFDHVPEYYYKVDPETGEGTWEQVLYTVVEESATSNVNPDEFAGKNGAVYHITIENVIEASDAAAGYIAVFHATNTLISKNVCIEKISKSNQETHLAGAKFDLYAYSKELENLLAANGKPSPEGTGKETYKGTYTTGENGRIDIRGLRFGVYYLIETKAPDGYVMLENPIELVVTENGVTVNFHIGGWDDASHVELVGNSKYEIRIPNELFYVLPSTGGLGIYWSMLGGVLLMAAASLLVYRNKRKEVL